MKQITVVQLKSLGACSDQVQLFEDTFGPVLEVKSLREAKALARKHTVFDTDWASEYLLSSEGYEDYRKATLPHLKAFEKAVIPYWEAYLKAVIPHLEAYRKVVLPHWEAYEKARALVFVEIWYKEG